MSNLIINPWEMNEESTSTSIPSFVEGRFVTVRLAAPKGKTVRDGLVVTLAMVAYKDEDDKDIELIKVTKEGNDVKVEFPFGKRGIMATKYRGPKSWYRFANNDTGKFYVIGKNDPVTKVNSKLTLEYAEDYLAKKTPEWTTLPQADRDDMIDQYFSEMFMYGLAKDYNLNVEADGSQVPYIGLVTNFYRRYTPPKEGEKFGNVIVTKFAPRENRENLSGEHTSVDEEIAASIYNALTTRETSNTSFDPTSFSDTDNSDEDVI